MFAAAARRRGGAPPLHLSLLPSTLSAHPPPGALSAHQAQMRSSSFAALNEQAPQSRRPPKLVETTVVEGRSARARSASASTPPACRPTSRQPAARGPLRPSPQALWAARSAPAFAPPRGDGLASIASSSRALRRRARRGSQACSRVGFVDAQSGGCVLGAPRPRELQSDQADRTPGHRPPARLSRLTGRAVQEQVSRS
jgi:hypothetical protein